MTPVSVRNIVKRFGAVRALDNVSVEVQQGELFFLLGPSGCGKTTLLRSIAGFYTPDEGSIHFGTRDVTHVPPQKRNCAMVFQNYALWPHMTVEANVAFGLAVRNVPRAERSRRAAEALEMVRMGNYARRKPNQLSGGQQQRVALARALVVRPDCLLLDEPLSNLDAKLRLEMRSEIQRLCKEFGLTGIYVTHDQKEALSIADRMAVLFAGRIAQLGPPRELYCRPANAQIADFLGETNFIRGSIRSRLGDEFTLSTPLGDLNASSHDREIPDSASDCLLSIRPEAVDIEEVCPSTLTIRPHTRDPQHRSVAPGPNRFSARIVDRLYLGETAQLTLSVGDYTLRANVLERTRHEPIHPGGYVMCRVDPRDVVILPKGPD